MKTHFQTTAEYLLKTHNLLRVFQYQEHFRVRFDMEYFAWLVISWVLRVFAKSMIKRSKNPRNYQIGYTLIHHDKTVFRYRSQSRTSTN
jgi:hypothetical protein